MRAARALVVVAMIGLLTMVAAGPGHRAYAGGDEEAAEFGAGLTDIGPDATEALRLAFRDDAEEWLAAALIILPAEAAAESDPKVWLDLCTQFSDSFESAVANATSAAEAYPDKAWTGDLPKDWKNQIRDGRKFILYMADAGYKAYSEWAGFAVWMKGYEADKTSMSGRITEIKKDFVKLDGLISKASVTVAEGKRDAAKKLKDVLKDVERMEQKTIPNDLETLGKYRGLIEERTTDADRAPDAVKKKLEDAAKTMDETVKLCSKVFPGAKGFAKEWARNGKELAEDYKEAYDDLVEATKPVMGDKPSLWTGLTQFEDWSYKEFSAKLTEARKQIQSEITRLEGIPLVD
jgi:hypothetical protein